MVVCECVGWRGEGGRNELVQRMEGYALHACLLGGQPCAAYPMLRHHLLHAR